MSWPVTGPRRPRPGPEKAAFDAWHSAGGPAAAMAILAAARVKPRDQAEFLRNVIRVPDHQIPGYLITR
ncbi:MAG: hypothetical protein ACRDRJ_22910 [Streptosporangiaceae bacterium]